jgi:hypothetical protein
LGPAPSFGTRHGSKPVLITSDNQILEKTSGLSERPGNVVLNYPIIKVVAWTPWPSTLQAADFASR